MIRFLLFNLVLTAISYGAVIEGVVLENKTGKPLARARIALEAIKGGSAVTPVYSDSSGNFRFRDVAAGSYQLMAERTGFVASRFGQSRYDMTGSPILVAADGHFFAQLRLQRPGLVAGAVLDENAVGLAGFTVSAYRVGTRPKLVASANTDDRGMYRFPALGPGRYVLITSARILEDGENLLPTFYGGSLKLAEARLIDVQLDGETIGIDIAPRPGKLNTIRGKIDAQSILAVQMLGDLGMQESSVRPDGSFEFRGVPAGNYIVIGGAVGASPISGAEAVTVAGEDRFVALKIGPSPTVQLTCRNTNGTKASTGLAMFLDRDRIADGQERRLDCDKALQLPAGPWKLRLLPLSGTYVDGLSGMGEPSEGRSGTFDLTLTAGDKREITATLGAKPARLLGKVGISKGSIPAIGVAVGLLAVADDVNRRMGGARLTRTDSEGKFRFDGLAPGDYRVIASPGLDSVAAVEGFGPGGQNVRLSEGEEGAVDIEWGQ